MEKEHIETGAPLRCQWGALFMKNKPAVTSRYIRPFPLGHRCIGCFSNGLQTVEQERGRSEKKGGIPWH